VLLDGQDGKCGLLILVCSVKQRLKPLLGLGFILEKSSSEGVAASGGCPLVLVAW
jgi:hypothetical protein